MKKNYGIDVVWYYVFYVKKTMMELLLYKTATPTSSGWLKKVTLMQSVLRGIYIYVNTRVLFNADYYLEISIIVNTAKVILAIPFVVIKAMFILVKLLGFTKVCW